MDIRKILRRFTKQQLLDDVWKVLNVLHAAKPDHRKSTKEEIISYIIKIAKDACLDMKKLIVLLEMKCCQVQASKRQWTAVEIKNPKFLVEPTTVPGNFAKKLSKYLNRSQLFCEVVSEFLNTVMWTAISVKQCKSQSNIFFLLAYAHLPILLHSYVRPSFQDIVCRSLVELFDGTDCKILSMKSKNADTLISCALKRVPSTEQLVPIEETENLPVPKKLKTNKVRMLQLPSNVINEDLHEENLRKQYLEQTFGPYIQPAFESLTYDVASDFYGFDEDQEKSFTVICKAIFKGENVLEGIQELVGNGMAEIPLPEYFTNVVQYGTNCLTLKAIEDKSKSCDS